jgi:hypothetical protein
MVAELILMVGYTECNIHKSTRQESDGLHNQAVHWIQSHKEKGNGGLERKGGLSEMIVTVESLHL